MKTWKGVAIFALVVMMVVMVAKKKGTHIHVHLRAPPPLHAAQYNIKCNIITEFEF